MTAEIESIAGMSPTGRRVTAPAFDLVELVAGNGLKHLAMVHQEQWRDHPALTADLQARIGFMEQPLSSGIARLVAHEPDTATFVYPSGTVWTVGEVVRSFADGGAGAGVKAGLELCYLVGEALVDAWDKSVQDSPRSATGHGNVNPWTLVIKGDGQPLILGYGVPQVELLAWCEDNRVALTEDSLRYAPPERLEGSGEDVSSDLFSLSLVALELMVGRPVYDGVLADVKQQATRAEGMRRLYQWREKLPQNVREVLGRALKPDPDTRFPNGLEFVYAVHELLGSIDVDGPSLTEVMAKVRASQKRGRALKGGQTGMLSAEEVAELAADLSEFEDKPLKPPRRPRPEADAPGTDGGAKPRWQRVVRPQPAAAAPAAPAADGERRRRVREGGTETLDTPVRAPIGAPVAKGQTVMTTPAASPGGASGATGASEARERLVRRLRTQGTVSSPDDLDPADVVPANTGKVPPPPEPARPGPEPASDDTAARAKTAAAALLERMRTSGDRRRRLRNSESMATTGAPPPTSTTSQVTVGPPSVARTSSSTMPLDRAPDRAAPTMDRAAPTMDTRPATVEAPLPPPPPPSVRSVMPTEATSAQRETALGPAQPLQRRTVEVTLGKRVERVSWRPEETTAAFALRAAAELGGWPVDPSGRLLGGFRATAGGSPLDPGATVSASAPITLEWVPAETRLVEVVVKQSPEIRFRTPLSLALPVRWMVAGVRQWLELPTGDWVLMVDGAEVDGDRLLADALGGQARVVLALR